VLPRLRQAVLAARDLDSVVSRLRERLPLGEPFVDPGIEYFGLRNAVFALGDTFLEVVSPIRPDTAAARLLDRRGGDCGYMVMFQVDDLDAARERVRDLGVREVWEISFADMAEVHLHPVDMRGAIVSLSRPCPPESWRWGGPDWTQRRAPLRLTGAAIAVGDPEAVAERWGTALGASPSAAGIRFEPDADERGPIEIVLAGSDDHSFELAGVRFVFDNEEER
jgi:Glyoxalase-like domain